MLLTSIIIFVFALLGGSTIAYLSLTKKKIPMMFAIGHGVAAVAGFVILAVAVVTTTVPMLATVAMWVFLLAAIGGAWLLIGYYLPYKSLPPSLIFTHGGLAVVGFILLLLAMLG